MGSNLTGIDLQGKSAIVTGGSIGIGSAIALKLAECGANVAINYRKHKEEAEEIINKIKLPKTNPFLTIPFFIFFPPKRTNLKILIK